MALFRFTRSRENRFLIAGGPCEFDPAIMFMNRVDFDKLTAAEKENFYRCSGDRIRAF
jgi:hypothetical protein